MSVATAPLRSNGYVCTKKQPNLPMRRAPAPFQTDKQRHDRAGRHRPQPAPPPVGDKARHNRTVAVAALRGPGDYFNAQGQRIRHVPGGSQIRVVASNDVRLLSQVNVHEGRNLKLVADIVAHYANGVLGYPGSYGASNAHGEEAIAYTLDEDHTYLAANKAGFVRPDIDDYHNLMSVLNHERNHRDDDHRRVNPTFATHFDVYLRQFKDPSFAATTQYFKLGETANAVRYLYNDYMTGRPHYQQLGFSDAIDALNQVLEQYDMRVWANPDSRDSTEFSIEYLKLRVANGRHWTEKLSVPCKVTRRKDAR